MPEHNKANTDGNTFTIPSLILHESRERRSRQDARLHSLRLLSRGALIVLLSVGAIAVAASETLAVLSLRLVLGYALGFTLAVSYVEVSAIRCWRDSPDIGRLWEDYQRPGRPPRPVVALQSALIIGARDDYAHNERVLVRVIVAIGVQAALTVAALVTLVMGFGELV